MRKERKLFVIIYNENGKNHSKTITTTKTNDELKKELMAESVSKIEIYDEYIFI
jgi:hypothetical protein